MLLYLLAGQPPTDFIHDPFGQFIINVAVAVVVGIVTAVVAIWIFRKQRTRKELSYQIISDAPIASVNKGLESRVTILLDGKPVKDARQVVLKIHNTGNIAVKRDDYDEPIGCLFEGSEIIGSDILSTDPEDLINSIDKNTFIRITRDSAKLERFLLNPNQSITLTFLLDKVYSKLKVGVLIIDGKIVKYDEYQDLVLNSPLLRIMLKSIMIPCLPPVLLLSAVSSSANRAYYEMRRFFIAH